MHPTSQLKHHSVIIPGKPRFESPIKVRWSTNLSDKPRIWAKKRGEGILRPEFRHTKLTLLSCFLISKTVNFVRKISPWKQHLQKIWSIPWRRQRKIQEICHFRFWVFKLSSQKFSDLKYAINNFFLIPKNAIFDELGCQIAGNTQRLFFHPSWSDGCPRLCFDSVHRSSQNLI